MLIIWSGEAYTILDVQVRAMDGQVDAMGGHVGETGASYGAINPIISQPTIC
jgi:hypothetical protein